MNIFIKKSREDNVATALINLKKNDTANIFDSERKHLEDLSANEMIPHGNKIALSDIKAGEKIIKCAEIIGICTENIKKGSLVHVHNVDSLSVDIPTEFRKEIMRQIRAIQEEGDKNEF